MFFSAYLFIQFSCIAALQWRITVACVLQWMKSTGVAGAKVRIDVRFGSSVTMEWVSGLVEIKHAQILKFAHFILQVVLGKAEQTSQLRESTWEKPLK